MNTIDIRRSVRSFQDKAVETEKIEKLLRAAMQAPSASNQRPWEFFVVKEATIKGEIAKMSPYAGPAKSAPLIIVVVANNERLRFPQNMEQDLGACSQNILLEAVELELGGTWMSVFPEQERVDRVKKVLDLPAHIIPYSIIIIGYPEKDDANRYIDRFEPERVHYL